MKQVPWTAGLDSVQMIDIALRMTLIAALSERSGGGPVHAATLKLCSGPLVLLISEVLALSVCPVP